MPRDNAAIRARAGKDTTTTVTIERPDTEIRGPEGGLTRLPRRREGADVVIHGKVNSMLLHPTTGHRVKHGQRRGAAMSGRPKTLSFGAVAVTAFVGFRVCQLLVRCFRRRQPDGQEQEELLVQHALEQQRLRQLPPVRVMPAMLQRALPKLGPPRRPKLLAQQARSRTRHVPSARQKLQAQGVVQRKALTLEKWHAAVQRQVGALIVQQQQQQQSAEFADLSSTGSQGPEQISCSRASAVLPLPAASDRLLLQPQPLLEVAAVEPQQHTT